MIIELLKRDPRLAGEVDQCLREESERYHKQHRDPSLVLNIKEGGHKGDHHQ